MLNTDRLCLGCMNDSGEEKICPICGYDSQSKNSQDSLPANFWLNDRYLIGKQLSSNGEGISYIGWDNGEDSIVTVKEYFPYGAAHRNPDKTVSIVKGSEYTFNEGLMSFKEINEIIMQNPDSGIVSVSAVFEENGTIYAVLQNVHAITLREFLTKNGGTLEWEQAKLLFMPLIDSVSKMNSLGITHRGISPETILVGRDGKLHLTGYCIRNLRIAESPLNNQVYSGYAATEQYGIEGMEEEGNTDVYGLCAVLFRTLIGTVPPEASARINNDAMTIPARFVESIPRNVLSALANGLQVNPKERTINAEFLKTTLLNTQTEDIPVPTRAAVEKERVGEDKKKPKKSGGNAKYTIISAVCTVLIIGIVGGILAGTVFKDELFGQEPETSSSAESFSEEPEVDVIGSYDSEAVENVALYPVPNLLGKYYSDIENDDTETSNYDKFTFTIKDKAYSNEYPKGTICSQSVKADKQVERDTEIKLVISLGPKEIKIANVVGLMPDNARLELLKQGFLYENIVVEEMYNSEEKPGCVLEQQPAYGSTVNTEIAVKIFINSYEGEQEDTQSVLDNTGSNTINVQ